MNFGHINFHREKYEARTNGQNTNGGNMILPSIGRKQQQTSVNGSSTS
jgi:hypothetical protein